MNLHKTKQAIDGAISTFEYLIANDKAALEAALSKNDARCEEAIGAIEAMRAMETEKVREYFREVANDLREASRVRTDELQRAMGDQPTVADIPRVTFDEGTLES